MRLSWKRVWIDNQTIYIFLHCCRTYKMCASGKLTTCVKRMMRLLYPKFGTFFLSVFFLIQVFHFLSRMKKKKILSPPLLVILLWFKILTYAVALEIFPLFQNNCICGQSFGIMPVVCGLNFLFFVFWIVLFVAGNILFVAGNVLFLAGDVLFVAGNVLCQN